jgi:hypothetical protein
MAGKMRQPGGIRVGFQSTHQAVRDQLARDLAHEHGLDLDRARQLVRVAGRLAVEDPAQRSLRHWFAVVVNRSEGRGRGRAEHGASDELDARVPGRETLLPEQTETTTTTTLDAATLRRMEAAFGVGFGDVAVVRNSPLATGSVRAVARPGEIHFRRGAYAPGTPAGDRVIAHELAHIVQHRGARGAAAPRAQIEREADRAAALAVQGRPAPIALRAQPGATYTYSDDEHHDHDDTDANVTSEPEERADGTPRVSRHWVATLAGSQGRPLPAGLRKRLELALKADLGDVRIHDGPASDVAAREINARAFTLGKDIHFAAGRYEPNTAKGQELIAHEVAHAVQSAHGDARGGGAQISTPGDAKEQEAERFASEFVKHEADWTAARAQRAERAAQSRPEPMRGDPITDERPMSSGRAVRSRLHGSQHEVAPRMAPHAISSMPVVIAGSVTTAIVHRDGGDGPPPVPKPKQTKQHPKQVAKPDLDEGQLSQKKKEANDPVQDAKDKAKFEKDNPKAPKDQDPVKPKVAPPAEVKQPQPIQKKDAKPPLEKQGGKKDKVDVKAPPKTGGKAKTPAAVKPKGPAEAAVCAAVDGDVANFWAKAQKDEPGAKKISDRSKQIWAAAQGLAPSGDSDDMIGALNPVTAVYNDGFEKSDLGQAWEGLKATDSPYKEFNDTYRTWAVNLGRIRDVAFNLSNVLGKIGLVLTVVGFILSLFGVGAVLITIGRVISVVNLVLDAVAAVAGLILVGITAAQIKSETDPYKKAKLAKLLMSDVNKMASNVVNVALGSTKVGRVVGKAAGAVLRGIGRVIARIARPIAGSIARVYASIARFFAKIKTRVMATGPMKKLSGVVGKMRANRAKVLAQVEAKDAAKAQAKAAQKAAKAEGRLKSKVEAQTNAQTKVNEATQAKLDADSAKAQTKQAAETATTKLDEAKTKAETETASANTAKKNQAAAKQELKDANADAAAKQKAQRNADKAAKKQEAELTDKTAAAKRADDALKEATAQKQAAEAAEQRAKQASDAAIEAEQRARAAAAKAKEAADQAAAKAGGDANAARQAAEDAQRAAADAQKAADDLAAAQKQAADAQTAAAAAAQTEKQLADMKTKADADAKAAADAQRAADARAADAKTQAAEAQAAANKAKTDQLEAQRLADEAAAARTKQAQAEQAQRLAEDAAARKLEADRAAAKAKADADAAAKAKADADKATADRAAAEQRALEQQQAAEQMKADAAAKQKLADEAAAKSRQEAQAAKQKQDAADAQVAKDQADVAKKKAELERAEAEAAAKQKQEAADAAKQEAAAEKQRQAAEAKRLADERLKRDTDAAEAAKEEATRKQEAFDERKQEAATAAKNKQQADDALKTAKKESRKADSAAADADKAAKKAQQDQAAAEQAKAAADEKVAKAEADKKAADAAADKAKQEADDAAKAEADAKDVAKEKEWLDPDKGPALPAGARSPNDDMWHEPYRDYAYGQWQQELATKNDNRDQWGWNQLPLTTPTPRTPRMGELKAAHARSVNVSDTVQKLFAKKTDDGASPQPAGPQGGSPQAPAPAPAPANKDPGQVAAEAGPLPYWPGLEQTYQFDLNAMAESRQAVTKYKQEQQKALATARDELQKRAKELRAEAQAKKAPINQNQQGLDKDKSNLAESKDGNQKQIEREDQADAEKNKADGPGKEGADAAEQAAAAEPPKPKGWWGRIKAVANRFLKATLGRAMKFVTDAISNVVLFGIKHLMGVDVKELANTGMVTADQGTQKAGEGSADTQKASNDNQKAEADIAQEDMTLGQRISAAEKNIKEAEDFEKAIDEQEKALQAEIKACNDFVKQVQEQFAKCRVDAENEKAAEPPTTPAATDGGAGDAPQGQEKESEMRAQLQQARTVCSGAIDTEIASLRALSAKGSQILHTSAGDDAGATAEAERLSKQIENTTLAAAIEKLEGLRSRDAGTEDAMIALAQDIDDACNDGAADVIEAYVDAENQVIAHPPMQAQPGPTGPNARPPTPPPPPPP